MFRTWDNLARKLTFFLHVACWHVLRYLNTGEILREGKWQGETKGLREGKVSMILGRWAQYYLRGYGFEVLFLNPHGLGPLD